jgi:hypothetical protein
MLHTLFGRTHKLEGFDDLLAIRMLVHLASGSVSEFVFVVRRYRIAEHQRVNDPDCTWLHCLPPTPIDPQNRRHARTVPIWHRVGGRAHSQTAYVHRESHFAHMFVRQAPTLGLGAAGIRDVCPSFEVGAATSTKKERRAAPREQQRGAERTRSSIAWMLVHSLLNLGENAAEVVGLRSLERRKLLV